VERDHDWPRLARAEGHRDNADRIRAIEQLELLGKPAKRALAGVPIGVGVRPILHVAPVARMARIADDERQRRPIAERGRPLGRRVRSTRNREEHESDGRKPVGIDSRPSIGRQAKTFFDSVDCIIGALAAAYDPPLVADAVNVSRTVVTTDLLRGNTASRSASATQALVAGSRGLLLASLATTLMRRPS